jgi:glycosyltransferase involved in cell wall biosynthesis
VIPYGLNLGDFAPRPQPNARELLGLSPDARVVLFVAADVSNQRKGFDQLTRALAQCAAIPNLTLLSIGESKPQIGIVTPWVHVGAVNNDRFLAMVYSAADVFVICSTQDNLPNTVLEALACGVPVVGHRVGGIPDMVRDGINGVTVLPGDASALGVAIGSLLMAGDKRSAMAANARRIAVQEYALELQATRYAALYSELISPTGQSLTQSFGCSA